MGGVGGTITSMFLHTDKHSNLIIFPAVFQIHALHFHHRSLWGGVGWSGERYVSLMCLYVSLFGAQSFPLSGAQSEPPTVFIKINPPRLSWKVFRSLPPSSLTPAFADVRSRESAHITLKEQNSI